MIATLPVDAIEVSSANPRRAFDPQALRELTESIRAQGVLQPVLVRPLATPNGKTHELIAGERRLRAARAAGLEAIPALVRELTDEQAAYARLVENLQRADLGPMEEAQGYATLREQGRSVAEVAAAVAKSQGYVYLRLELLSLPAVAKKALAGGELTVAVALLLARIPDEKAREEASTQVLQGYGGSPMGYRKAQEYIVRAFMLALDKAPFATDDASLVPTAGTCAACPHRTGNQRELFADVKGKDVCSKPSCYAAKREAAWLRRAEEAKAAGQTVVDEKDARRLFPYAGGHLAHQAPYVDLDARCEHDPKRRTWRQLLRKHRLPTAVARDVEGAVHELVQATAAREALREARPEVAEVVEKAAAPEGPSKEERAEQRERGRVLGLARRAAIEQLVARVEKKAFSLDAWILVADMLLAEVWRDSAKAVARRRELGGERPVETIRTHLASLDSEGAIRGLIVELLLARGAVLGNDLSDSLKTACRLYGVDLKALVLAAKKEVRDGGRKKGKA